MDRFTNGMTRKALLIGAALAGLAAAGPIQAQQASTGDDAADSNDIIVTAQKRSELLQDVPASVSVVVAEDLTQQGIVRFSDYASKVPGLSLTSGRTGQAQVTLRGITTGAAQGASSTGYYLDEAPIGSVNAYTGGSSTTPDLDPSDLVQIEVLKGPQGTLYGAGAVGGLLKFVTTSPNFDTLGGSLSAGVTSASKGEVGYAVRGMINLPLAADQLVLRVSGFNRRDPGYIDNLAPRIGRKDINRATIRGGRAVLAMKLGPDVRVDVSAIGQDTKTNGTNLVDVDAVTLKQVNGDLKQLRYSDESGFVKFRLYNATIRADLGGLDLVSSTTYQHTNFLQGADGTNSYGLLLSALTGIPGFGLRTSQETRTERWSEELRLGKDGIADGLLDLQGGFYWTHEDDSNRIPSFDPFFIPTGAPLPLPPLAVASILSTYKEYSFFGNGTLHLGDRFDLLGGIRYSHDKQDYIQDYSGLIVGPRRINIGTEKGDIVTWLASPRYRFSDDAMVYGRVATGYRPGGPNAVPPPAIFPAPDTFDPDKLTQYELGFKGTLLDRKLSVDLALFYTDWKDIQIQTSAAGFNFFVNGGTARSQGGEVTLRYAPVEGLNLGFNAAYTDAKLTSDAPAAGGVDGDRLPYVPRWAGSFSADYSVPIGNELKAVIGGSVNYTGNRQSDYSGRLSKYLSSYTTANLRAGIDNGRWSLSVFAKNLTDKRAIIAAGTQGFAPSNTPGDIYGASLIQPRTIGAEASIRF